VFGLAIPRRKGAPKALQRPERAVGSS